MSAYVVDDDVISVIIAGLASLKRPGVYISMPEQLVGFDIASPDDALAVGKRLKRLNVRAVCERYHDDEPSNYEEYVFVRMLPPSMTKLYDALRTYLYQCAEGRVVKTRLYRQMTELKNDVACAYINNAIERSAQ